MIEHDSVPHIHTLGFIMRKPLVREAKAFFRPQGRGGGRGIKAEHHGSWSDFSGESDNECQVMAKSSGGVLAECLTSSSVLAHLWLTLDAELPSPDLSFPI